MKQVSSERAEQIW